MPRRSEPAAPGSRTAEGGAPSAPGEGGAPSPLAESLTHLRNADPVLGELMDRFGTDGIAEPRRGRPADRYGTLVRAIVGQQLSTLAARAIYGRLTDRFGGRPPTPEEVLADDPDELRVAAGLSHAKVRYLRSLAEHVLDGSLALNKLGRLSDEQVIAELVAVKGLGVWSAHMFLMFDLGRPDVLAVGDLGIRRAIMIAYGLPALPAPAEMERIAEPWRPHRTLACEILWHSVEARPV